jgi:PAS domain S-box-containing protein
MADATYASALEDMPTAVLTTTVQGLILTANAKARELLGDVTGRDITSLVVPEERELAEQRVAETAEGAPLTPRRWRVWARDGSTLMVEAVSRLAFDLGGNEVLLGTVIPVADLPADPGSAAVVNRLETQMLSMADWMVTQKLALERAHEQLNLNARRIKVLSDLAEQVGIVIQGGVAKLDAAEGS